MSISCLRIHYHRELGDSIPLQTSFQLGLSQTTWKTASRIQSAGWRPKLVLYSVEWSCSAYPHPGDSLATPANPKQWQRPMKLPREVFTSLNLKEWG